MTKKRYGIIFLVLLVITMPLVLPDDSSTFTWNTYNWFTSAKVQTYEYRDMLYDDSNQDTDTVKSQMGSPRSSHIDNWCETEIGDDIGEPSAPPEESDLGCLILLVEIDTETLPLEPNADECSGSYAKQGSIIPGHTFIDLRSILRGIVDEIDWDDDDDDGEVLHLWNDYWSSGTPILCGTDNRWYGCYSYGNHDSAGQLLSVEVPGSDSSTTTETFLCYYDSDTGRTYGHYRWFNVKDVPSEVDQDDDHVPDSFDCAPNDKYIHGAFPLGCNPLAQEGEEGFCAVQAAAEICGDGVDNDCSDLDYLPDTSDDCDQNQLSCEQTTDYLKDADGINIDDKTKVSISC